MRKVLVLNPKNENELKKFEALDIDMDSVIEKSKYEEVNSTQFYRVLYTEDKGKVADFCTLDLTRDLKTCILTFSTMDQSKRTRPFIEQAVSFANEIGSEEVMLSINPDDIKTKKILDVRKDFSAFPIDIDDRSIIFIHEEVNELVNCR